MRILSEVKVFVFDLDDTLVLERDYVRSGFEAVGRLVWAQIGVEGFAAAAWRLFEQGRRREIFDEVFSKRGMSADPEFIAGLVDVYRSHRPRIRLLPDARELLQAIKRDGGRSALISDGPPSSQRAKLDALGLSRSFDRVVLTAEHGAGFSKPCLKPFQWMQQSFGTAPEAMVYIADNPRKDFAAPAALDWRTVRVRRRGGIYADIACEGVDAEVADLFELLPLRLPGNQAAGASGRGWPARPIAWKDQARSL